MTASKYVPQAIPGYQMLRLLGKGGMAEVYLAHQDSVDREVAVKLMSRHLLTDPRFAERFLREARIAAKLQHRHVVSIFDVGVSNEQPYIAMEYLSGGPVMPHDDEPLSVDQALRCVYEIALALDYAHNKGYIHRDVKPDNILLRDDGSCVLSDFGIARTVDSATMMTKTGSVVGTPFYMSPEQLRGKEVDGRADLYSLGVVFFQLLTGKVPYTASDSLAIGIMHMTAPIPRLPMRYSYLQPLLDRMLAKEAGDRVQTGREMAEMVRNFQQGAMADDQKYLRTQPQTAVGPAPTGAPVVAQISTRKVVPVPERRIEPNFGTPRAAGAAEPVRGNGSARIEPSISPTSQPAGGRIEPNFGANKKTVVRAEPALGQMDPAMESAAWRKPVEVRPAKRVWPWLLLLLVAGAGVGFWQRDELSARWAQWQNGQSAPEALAAARTAEASGRLFDDTDGDAISLYEAALRASPDNASARAGLARVVSMILTQTQERIASDPTRAEAMLARLERTQNADPRVGTLRARMRPAANTDVKAPPLPAADPIEVQLDKALAAERAREWLGVRGALARYSFVLRNDPNNQRAKAGVKTSEAAAAELLDRAIATDDLAQIERIKNEWEAAQPESVERQLRMRKWRAKQSDAEEQRANITLWLREAQTALLAGQLTSPPGQSAADRFAAVLVLEPKNAEALAGLKKISAELIAQAETAIKAQRLEMAEKLIAQAQERGATKSALASVQGKLEKAREALAPPTPPVQQDPETLAKRAQLLGEIDSALAQNALLDPPGQNAFDLLRQIQRLGPGADIAERIDRLSSALKVQLSESIEASDFENAANVLSSLRSLGPDPSLNGMRSQLIESVISDIRAKIDAGAFDAAERRISLLKQMDNHHPELPDLQLALVTAKGAG